MSMTRAGGCKVRAARAGCGGWLLAAGHAKLEVQQTDRTTTTIRQKTSPKCDQSATRNTYRRLALGYHLDHCKKPYATQKFKDVTRVRLPTQSSAQERAPDNQLRTLSTKNAAE